MSYAGNAYNNLFDLHVPIEFATRRGAEPMGKYLVVKRQRDDKTRVIFEEYNDVDRIKAMMYGERFQPGMYVTYTVHNLHTGVLLFKEDWDG
jgi:HKD family nuclease